MPEACCKIKEVFSSFFFSPLSISFGSSALQHEHPRSLVLSPSWESPDLPCSIPDVPTAIGFPAVVGARWSLRDQTPPNKVPYETPTQARSSHVSSPRFWLIPILFFIPQAGTDEQRGIFGPRSIHNLPLVEGCPCLFVQILPAQVLFDVFKGAILMLRKEGKCRLDEARHSKLFFTQKSASLCLKKYIYSVFQRLIYG